MSVQRLLRRPSNPILIAISGALILLFILFKAGPLNIQPTTRYFGLGSSSSSLLDDIFNTTLGFERILVVGLPTRTDRRDAMILSAALSNMEVEFVDGVLGESVKDSVIPSPEGKLRRLGNSSIGSWRGHMNAIQDCAKKFNVRPDFEDDADWDVRLKEQLRDFALSSHALIQPLSNSPSSYADPTYPTPADPSQKPTSDLSFDKLPATLPPKTSPYGDNWDILWIGHCGMKFPHVPGKDIPKGRVARTDHTVPQRDYLETISNPDELKNQYPDHSRVVHHVQEGICSLVYAISQAGARRLLYEAGIHHKLDAPYDILLRRFCEGTSGRKYHNCLTVNPSLFHHHRPVGPKSAESDIQSHGDGYRKTAKTPVLRWSTRMNWEVLLDGRTDFVDQWPDK